MAIRHLLPCTETQASHLFEKTMQEEGLPPPSPATTPPMKQEMSCIVSERKGGIKPLALFFSQVVSAILSCQQVCKADPVRAHCFSPQKTLTSPKVGMDYSQLSCHFDNDLQSAFCVPSLQV